MRLDHPNSRANLDRQIALLFTRIEQEPHEQLHWEIVDELWKKSANSIYASQLLVKCTMPQVELVLIEKTAGVLATEGTLFANASESRAVETLNRHFRAHRLFGKAADFMLYMARRPPPASVSELCDASAISPDFSITSRLQFFGQCDGSLKQSFRTEARGPAAAVDANSLRMHFEMTKIQFDLYSVLLKQQIALPADDNAAQHTAGRFVFMAFEMQLAVVDGSSSAQDPMAYSKFDRTHPGAFENELQMWRRDLEQDPGLLRMDNSDWFITKVYELIENSPPNPKWATRFLATPDCVRDAHKAFVLHSLQYTPLAADELKEQAKWWRVVRCTLRHQASSSLDTASPLSYVRCSFACAHTHDTLPSYLRHPFFLPTMGSHTRSTRLSSRSFARSLPPERYTVITLKASGSAFFRTIAPSLTYSSRSINSLHS